MPPHRNMPHWADIPDSNSIRIVYQNNLVGRLQRRIDNLKEQRIEIQRQITQCEIQLEAAQKIRRELVAEELKQ